VNFPEVETGPGFERDWSPLDELPPLRVSMNANDRRNQRRARRRKERQGLDTKTKHYGRCRGCKQWGRVESPKRALCARCLPALKQKLERTNAQETR
jgi:hypothetical protein